MDVLKAMTLIIAIGFVASSLASSNSQFAGVSFGRWKTPFRKSYGMNLLPMNPLPALITQTVTVTCITSSSEVAPCTAFMHRRRRNYERNRRVLDFPDIYHNKNSNNSLLSPSITDEIFELHSQLKPSITSFETKDAVALHGAHSPGNIGRIPFSTFYKTVTATLTALCSAISNFQPCGY